MPLSALAAPLTIGKTDKPGAQPQAADAETARPRLRSACRRRSRSRRSTPVSRQQASGSSLSTSRKPPAQRLAEVLVRLADRRSPCDEHRVEGDRLLALSDVDESELDGTSPRQSVSRQVVLHLCGDRPSRLRRPEGRTVSTSRGRTSHPSVFHRSFQVDRTQRLVESGWLCPPTRHVRRLERPDVIAAPAQSDVQNAQLLDFVRPRTPLRGAPKKTRSNSSLCAMHRRDHDDTSSTSWMSRRERAPAKSALAEDIEIDRRRRRPRPSRSDARSVSGARTPSARSRLRRALERSTRPTSCSTPRKSLRATPAGRARSPRVEVDGRRPARTGAGRLEGTRRSSGRAPRSDRAYRGAHREILEGADVVERREASRRDAVRDRVRGRVVGRGASSRPRPAFAVLVALARKFSSSN